MVVIVVMHEGEEEERKEILMQSSYTAEQRLPMWILFLNMSDALFFWDDNIIYVPVIILLCCFGSLTVSPTGPFEFSLRELPLAHATQLTT